MEFTGFNPVLRQLRTDNSYRIEIDVPEVEYDQYASLGSPEMKGKLLKIKVSLVEENQELSDTWQEFNKIRAVYCSKFGQTKDEFNEKYLNGKSSKELSDKELAEATHNMKTSLRYHTP